MSLQKFHFIFYYKQYVQYVSQEQMSYQIRPPSENLATKSNSCRLVPRLLNTTREETDGKKAGHRPLIFKVCLHTAINRADFVSWCMLYTYDGNKM